MSKVSSILKSTEEARKDLDYIAYIMAARLIVVMMGDEALHNEMVRA